MSTETTSAPEVPKSAPASKPVSKLSGVEEIKENSRQLRGTIAEELAQDSDHFGEQTKQLLKFHGSYQQEDRDARKNRKKVGVGKHYMFMVRCKIPGGRLTTAQYLAVDDLAGKYGNSTLRFTSRQGIQLHGVLKGHLRETIAGINDCLLSTLGACGDVERNVMACPAPHYQSGVHAQLQETAATLAAHLAPRSRAYHEIWLNGQPIGGGNAVPSSANPATEMSRSMARCTSHASSRPAWPYPRTTASISTPRISGCWPSCRTARSSVTTCWSAAAWG
jgi:sulfite reductase beta subunit-like hemoprotein